jgi:hypothetical protein
MPMTPEKERELVEKMAQEINPECFEPEVVKTYGDLWALRQQEKMRSIAKTALSIAAPILRNEALEEAAAKAESTWLETTFVGKAAIHAGENMCRIVAAAIRSLKTKDQPE